MRASNDEEPDMIRMHSNRVFEEALSLPTNTRFVLVDRLLASLNLPTPSEDEQEWKCEVERRAAEIDGGQVQLIPGDEVVERIRAKLSRR